MRTSIKVLFVVGLGLLLGNACKKESPAEMIESADASPTPKSGGVPIFSTMAYSGNIFDEIRGADTHNDVVNTASYHLAMALKGVSCDSAFVHWMKNSARSDEDYYLSDFSSYSFYSLLEDYFNNIGYSIQDFQDSLEVVGGGYELSFILPNADNCNFENPPIVCVGVEVDTSDYDDYIPGWEAGNTDCESWSKIVGTADDSPFKHSKPVLIGTTSSLKTLHLAEADSSGRGTDCDDCWNYADTLRHHKFKFVNTYDRGKKFKPRMVAYYYYNGSGLGQNGYTFERRVRKFNKIENSAASSEYTAQTVKWDYSDPLEYDYIAPPNPTIQQDLTPQGNRAFVAYFEHDFFAGRKKVFLIQNTAYDEIEIKLRMKTSSDVWFGGSIHFCSNVGQECKFDFTDGSSGYYYQKGY